MNRRRLAAAIFFSVVIVLVLGVMVYLEQAGRQQTVTVFILKHAVLAGSPVQRRRRVRRVRPRAGG